MTIQVQLTPEDEGRRVAVGESRSSAATASLEGPIDLDEQIASLFRAAQDETFEDGMESRFSQDLCLLVRSVGQVAVEAIGELIEAPHRSYEGASEAMRWLGRLEDPPTQSIRLWLLEKALEHPSAKVRDGAALGLCSMGHAHAIPYLQQAIESEAISELRDDMQQILDELKDIPSCRT